MEHLEEEEPLLGDENEFEEEEYEADGAQPDSEAKSFLSHLQAEAAVHQSEVPDGAPGPDPMSVDLRNVPDKDDIAAIFRENITADSPQNDIKEHHVELPEEIPQNLHHAMFMLGERPKDVEVFDCLWRLAMYLRHWKGGCDRTWIRNARLCRVRSSSLNWYQLFGVDLFNDVQCLLNFG